VPRRPGGGLSTEGALPRPWPRTLALPPRPGAAMIPRPERVRRVQATSARPSGRQGWIGFGLWIAVILGMSSIPNLGPPDVGLPWADKVCHLGEYGVLGWLFARARGAGASSARRALWGGILGACMGAIDENYQRLTPGRDVSALDAAADIAGAALGAFLGPLWLDPAWHRLRRMGAKRGA